MEEGNSHTHTNAHPPKVRPMSARRQGHCVSTQSRQSCLVPTHALESDSRFCPRVLCPALHTDSKLSGENVPAQHFRPQFKGYPNPPGAHPHSTVRQGPCRQQQEGGRLWPGLCAQEVSPGAAGSAAELRNGRGIRTLVGSSHFWFPLLLAPAFVLSRWSNR